MKTINIVSILVLTGLTAFAVDSSVQKRGTDVLHYSVREAFAPQNNSAVQGGVYLTRKEQGNAHKQTLDIVLRKLEPNTSYNLLAYPMEGTTYCFTAVFAADAKGRATLRYVAQNNERGLGNGKQPLPAELNPVTSLREMVVTDVNDNVVASAVLTAPDKVSYLVKRDLSTTEVPAMLRIKANQNQATIKLSVAGLDETKEYGLALNGTITENHTAPSGKLVIYRHFEDPLEVIGLRSISLMDVSGTEPQVVVGTDLP